MHLRERWKKDRFYEQKRSIFMYICRYIKIGNKIFVTRWCHHKTIAKSIYIQYKVISFRASPSLPSSFQSCNFSIKIWSFSPIFHHNLKRIRLTISKNVLCIVTDIFLNLAYGQNIQGSVDNVLEIFCRGNHSIFDVW